MGQFKFKSLEEANDFVEEIEEGVSFEDLASVDLHEFHSDALADRIERRKKLKDHAKSREAKKQFASDFSRDRLSNSLVKFNQTAAGKRLRQRVQQLRKDGRYDKFETLQVLNNVQGALMQEARYSRDIVEEVHTELCVERLLSLSIPFLEALLTEDLSNDEVCVLMNVGELAESIDTMLGIDEGVVGHIVIAWDDEQDDEVLGGNTVVESQDDEVLEELEDDLPVLRDITESYLPPSGKMFEALDRKHGQTSTKTFDPVAAGDLLPGVLAKYTGPAFFLNSISRNNRFYSEEVWRNAIADPEFVDRMERRVMYGAIGHDVEITEETLRTGMVSHIVTGVEIKNDGIGYATYEILDTESGRQLHTYLASKNGLKTSTRAYGRPLKGRRNEDLPRGIEEIDPKNFKFVGIDFVIDPGFLGSETL